MSRFTLSVTYTVFNNKLSRYVRPILPTLVYRNVYLNVSKYIPPPPSAFLLTLFNVLDRFYRERQARSLARSLAPSAFSSFPLLSSPRTRVNYSRTCPADRPRRRRRRRRRQRTFTSRAAFGRVCRITTTGETPRPTTRTDTDGSSTELRSGDPSDLLAARSDRSRSLHRNSRARLGKALPLGPLARSIDPSIDVANFPSSERSHWIRRRSATFHRSFSRSFRKKK